MVVALAFWKTRLARREVALMVGIGGGLGFQYSIYIHTCTCTLMQSWKHIGLDACLHVCMVSSCLLWKWHGLRSSETSTDLGSVCDRAPSIHIVVIADSVPKL